LPDNDPRPQRMRDDQPPRYLKGRLAKAKWKELARDLRNAGTLARTDRDMLAKYCEYYELSVKAYTRMIALDDECTTEGFMTPQFKTWERITTKMLPIARELGLSPASRARVTAIINDDKGSDEWDNFDEQYDAEAEA